MPRKLSKQSPLYYTMYMGLGYFLSSILMYTIVKYIFNMKVLLFSPILLLALLSGILWLSGTLLLIKAVDQIGISRTNQWRNLQGPIGSILMLFFFKESTNRNVLLLILAIIIIFISALILNIKNEQKKKSNIKGVTYALLSAIFFGINAFFKKYMLNDGLIYTQQMYVSGTVFILSTLIIFIKKKDFQKTTSKNNYLPIIGGILYYFASYLFITAYKYIPGSIAFSIVQLNAVWTILIGIFIFKEINFRNNWVRILIGIMLSVVGIVFLLLSQK